MGADDPEEFDPVIHQAEGLLSARLAVPIADAEMIMRTRARTRGVSLELFAWELMAAVGSPDPNIAGSC